MPSFSKRSSNNLDSCDWDLQRLFRRVVKKFDCTVIVGHRTEEAQDEAFRTGHSKKEWPDSKHNTHPSIAVDVAPYPIDWNDRERFSLFAGYVLGVASEMGINIRWGGDWDRDTQVKDNTFDDLVHFEIVKNQ
jgi:peptidoglycan L-alanyl-D-glutamate endopeptidase CwlK